MKSKLRVLVFVALVIGLVMVAAAVPARADEVGPSVPFTARCVTYPQIQFPVVPPVMYVDIPADCLGTHLGNATFYSYMSVLITDPTVNPQWGDLVFTAANGDELWTEFLGAGGPPADPVRFAGDFWITGGTGRFEGASGGGTYSGYALVSEGVGEIFFDGTLTKP